MHPGATTGLAACRDLHHVALRVADMQGAVIFWRDRLGLPEVRRHLTASGAVRSVWLALGAQALLMLEHADPGARQHGAGWAVVVLCARQDERAALEQRLGAAGIAIVQRTDYTLYVDDPEGNRVGFSHYDRGP